MDENLSARVASFARNPTLLKRSRDVTRIEPRSGRPINRGVEIRDIEIAIGRRIPRRELVDTHAPTSDRGRIGHGDIPFFRPEVRGSTDRGAPPPRVRMREAVPAPVMRQRELAERRRFEQALAQERARLENAHRRELQAPGGRAPAEVRKRQEQEFRAFERHARQQRQVLEERLRKRLYDQRASGPRGKEEDREGGRGKSRGHDSRG